MTTSKFMKEHKDTKKIVSMQYQSGIFDCVLTAYPAGLMNPHVVQFHSQSFTNLSRLKRLLDEVVTA